MNSMGKGGGFGGNTFSHKAPILSTDMRCYFECPEGFKKDYDLRLHIKLKHRTEDPEELRRAFQACEEEIALTTRTASLFQCAICPKKLNESGKMADHIKNKHGISWSDYKDQYGRCEIESAPFECKICGRVIKYDRKTIQPHMKHVHRITWEEYLDRIRKMRRGQMTGELPDIEMFECKICNATVKFLFKGKHLKRVHKITESEYVELFQDELLKDNNKPTASKPNYRKEDNDDSYNDTMSMPTYTNNEQPIESNQNQYNNPNQWRDLSNNQVKNEYGEEDYNTGDNNMRMQDNGQKFRLMESKFQPNSSSQDYELPDQPLPPPSVPNKFLLKPPKSDIQDVSNKRCSSCQIQFDSRRKFIEHCTTAHRMKFKTASGATIAAPLAQTHTKPQLDLNQNKDYYDGEAKSINSFQNSDSNSSTKTSSFSNDSISFQPHDTSLGHSNNIEGYNYNAPNLSSDFTSNSIDENPVENYVGREEEN